MAARTSAATPVAFAARWRRAALLLGAGALCLTALVGVLHLPFARGLLGRAGGCPFVNAKATPEALEPARHAALAGERGASPAPARPAFGFTLDRTTQDDVDAWADREQVACEEARKGLVLCTHVAPRALGLPEIDGPVDELDLGFDTGRRLVNLTTLRVHLTSAAAATAAKDIAARLAAQLGSPQGHDGAFDDGQLSQVGAGSLASLRYRFHDYFADVSAMHFAEDGVVLREHYMSAAD